MWHVYYKQRYCVPSAQPSNDQFSEGLFIWARSTGLARFPRSRLATLFFLKISTRCYGRPGWPDYLHLGFCDRNLGNWGLPVWTLQPVDRDQTCMYFHFRSMRISFISKVTRVHKAMTVANNTSLCFTWIHPGRQGWNFSYEHTTEFVPVTEPTRFPGSYGKARKKRKK